MRPKPPPSTGHHHSMEVDVAIWGACASAIWEVGWLVLTLAGADPRGQLPQAFGRVWPAVGRALVSVVSPNHPSPDWLQVLWDLGHPVSPVAVVLVIVGLLLTAAIVARAFWRLLIGVPGRGGRFRWPRQQRGSAAPNRPRVGATVDRSLDDWLASVANGDDDE